MLTDYIKKRTEELRFCDYKLRLRVLHFSPSQIKFENLNFGEFWVIDEDRTDSGIILESDKGYYDESNAQNAETVVEHSGDIRIENVSSIRQTLRFIQVIQK